MHGICLWNLIKVQSVYLTKTMKKELLKKLKSAKKNGDTLGGTFYVVVSGLPVGLGSFIQYDTKLSSAIAHDMMSINAVKGVEIGTGFETANNPGSVSHDEIVIEMKLFLVRVTVLVELRGNVNWFANYRASCYETYCHTYVANWCN